METTCTSGLVINAIQPLDLSELSRFSRIAVLLQPDQIQRQVARRRPAVINLDKYRLVALRIQLHLLTNSPR